MDKKTTYDTVFQFFKSLVTDLFSKSVTNESYNILSVFNTHAFASGGNEASSNASFSKLMSDSQLSQCIKFGLEFLKTFILGMETDGGIPVTGGSVESWRTDSILIDIISNNIKLHRLSEFVIDEQTIKLADGVLRMKARWPEPFLSQKYVLNGFLEGKKATGRGDFKIIVTNFVLDLQLNFSEKEKYLTINDFKIRANFDDVRVQVTGLTVDDTKNPEEIMNSALQRDKQKFKEMLSTNTLVLSEQTTAVLNSKLQQMTKKQIVEVLNYWCNKK